jgi:hypothetical protein
MKADVLATEKPALTRIERLAFRPTTSPGKTMPVAIKPTSSLLLGFSISCLAGVALAKSLNAFFDLGSFGPYLIAAVSICIFANGLRLVPTFHQGVMVLLGHRIPRFVLTEGCHWLLPMIYEVRPVAIKQEILEINDFRVTTNSEAKPDSFVELRMQASIQWQVTDPGKFLENEKEAVEILLKRWVIESIRSITIEEEHTYASIVKTSGKSASAKALDLVRRKADSLGTTVSDITILQVKQTSNPEAHGTNGEKQDPWVRCGLR